MIVKSMTRKAPSFAQLLAYIAAEGKGVGEPLLHNLGGDGHDLAAVTRAFMANARLVPARRNGVALYHEVLSLAGADPAEPAMLYDLAAHYLALRAPQALAYGLVHADGPNPHIHLVISANLRGRPRKMRLARARFAAIKHELEAYQRERYPELTHSLAFTVPAAPERAEGEPAVRGRAEGEAHRRLRRVGEGPPSIKAFLAQAVSDGLTVATSEAGFEERLAGLEIAPYARGGRLAGVRYQGKKYRLRTLGVPEAALDRAERRWRTAPARLRGLADLLTEKARRLWRGFGYAEQMLAVLERSHPAALPVPVRERVHALERLQHEQWRRRREHARERCRGSSP